MVAGNWTVVPDCGSLDSGYWSLVTGCKLNNSSYIQHTLDASQVIDFFESEEGWWCGRYRKVYRQHLIPDGKLKPLAITECGVDIIPPVGWKNHFSEDEHFDQLVWYDGNQEDDQVPGVTIFALEIPGWHSFDIAPTSSRLADYVAP